MPVTRAFSRRTNKIVGSHRHYQISQIDPLFASLCVMSNGGGSVVTAGNAIRFYTGQVQAVVQGMISTK